MSSDFVVGFMAAAAVAFAAWRLRALDTGGAISSWVAGGIIFSLGGLRPSTALLAFFISGSLLSSLPEHRRSGPLLLREELAGGYARNWKQVGANGFVPFAAIIAGRLIPSLEAVFLHAFYGSIAAACADSWGTEVGTRFGKRVRNIMTGHELTPGLSGGISFRGIAGSLGGSALIALAAALPFTKSVTPGKAWAILMGGFLGAIADSIFGATLQAKFQRSGTKEILETLPPPKSGIRPARLIAGYKQIRNNSVNLAASAIGALIVVLILDFR